MPLAQHGGRMSPSTYWGDHGDDDLILPEFVAGLLRTCARSWFLMAQAGTGLAPSQFPPDVALAPLPPYSSAINPGRACLAALARAGHQGLLVGLQRRE